MDHVDVVRLDHFRGFAAAWHVPAGSLTAQTGQWMPGPGAGFFQAVQKELGRLPFLAEDLGLITPDVLSLRDELRIPGTRVFQFAFDGHPDNPYLPHNFVPNTVVYRDSRHPRPANGKQNWRKGSARLSGITFGESLVRPPTPHRR